MSKFLGPIHYWLYNKIQIQEGFVKTVIDTAQTKWHIDLASSCYTKYGQIAQGDLEDIIDTTQIHGWLQSQLSVTEYQFAYCVTELIKQIPDAMETLKEAFEDQGQAKRKKMGEGLALKALYQEIQDSLIDGMPCDHVNEVLEATEEAVVWQRNQCVHKAYWEAEAGEVSCYYALREAWLKGFVETGKERFQVVDEHTYKISK
ncbi:hypothetical protein PBV87_09805 [Niameybacter massiliensis]|uniref:Uncharacterized protein n=1 Tax=Holtiella tumoricola TaxID=3018743 RepID=A0AA42DN43_9FIRM|nr:hypothetical protein [Holtiella tumoricola]MDA3731771.1 hypothetical protein [Holtiella tumoricola]